MARRDDMPLSLKQRPSDKVAQQKNDQDQDQEQEVGTERSEPEHARAQNMFGNAALASALGGASVAGVDGNIALRQDPELEGMQFGGDDADDGDAPLTIEDLTRDWDRGRATRKSDESTSFVEPMPYDDLPPEDTAWMAQVRSTPVPDEPRADDLTEALLQPSGPVLGGPAMRGWLLEAVRWSRADPLARVVGATAARSSPLLQDPHGRVVCARLRAGAIATQLVLDGPGAARRDPFHVALLQLCLELAGGRRRVDEVHEATRARGEQLPLALNVLTHHLPHAAEAAPEHRAPDDTTRSAQRLVGEVLTRILSVPSAMAIVPDLPDLEAPGQDPDDPLGLDDILAEFTGGRPDPREGAYQAAIIAAERLAGTTALLRVRAAGAAVAVSDAGRSWLSGAPYGDLALFADGLDRETKRVLGLVVEVARAIRARSVEPQGIRNGLRRAARMLDRLRTQVVSRLATTAVTILPRAAALPSPAEIPDDALAVALDDRRPVDALDALEAWPEAPERTAAETLLRAMARPHATHGPTLLAAAGQIRAAGRPELATALEICAGPALIRAGELGACHALAERHQATGYLRRNGLLVAAGGLLAIDAHRALGDLDAARAARLRAGVLAYHTGAGAAFSALARWTPPPEEP